MFDSSSICPKQGGQHHKRCPAQKQNHSKMNGFRIQVARAEGTLSSFGAVALATGLLGLLRCTWHPGLLRLGLIGLLWLRVLLRLLELLGSVGPTRTHRAPRASRAPEVFTVPRGPKAPGAPSAHVARRGHRAARLGKLPRLVAFIGLL